VADDLSLKALLQSMMQAGNATVLQGVVKSTSPLQIQAVNDDKLVIGASITYVPRHLTEYETEVTVDWRTEEESGDRRESSERSLRSESDGGGWAEFAAHSHAIKGRKKILVHNGLQVGEKVHILAFNQGKQYYVLDRVKA